ncbi:MAG: XdhC family protein [Acidobacteriota bacterium]|nr:XdhC family protein [Acidobacteriota bacterium]TDI07875.1 MAG: xanthine dehydrogenase [Acidobacteriota bacterium]TDI12620.1 MAG: xanthine dehydrogenase [Acidobacteriota bacterium]
MDIFEEIVRLRREGGKAALATVVKWLGSTPRRDNAKMLILEDGSTMGSIGGGSTEAEVVEEARRVLETEKASLTKFTLTQEEAARDGLICGGTVEVFVEPILPDPSLLLMGGGHLAQAIAEAAQRVSFKVSVVDDRASFANRERFPGVEETIVASFEESLDSIDVTENTFILIVTRGHGYDQVVLEKAIQSPARYVGLVGSRRKIRIILKNLLDKGIPPKTFSNLYAPIGLEIGSETPQEIAVSVIAELISLRKGVHQRSKKQLFAMKLIEESGAQSQAEAR